MSKRRRLSRSSRAMDLDLSDIKYDTTCINIVPGGLPLSIACEVCHPKFDIHTKKSSQKSKKQRHKHITNKCKQFWMSKWSNGNIGPLKKHNFTRGYLNINQDVEIQFEEANKSNSNLTSTQKIIETEEGMSSNCSEHSLKPNKGFKEYLDKRKDMLPTDMPDVTEDVVNVLPSHTPCVTGEVVNVLPSHTLAGGVINTNPSHANSIYVGESDATGDVVNVLPSHISAGGVINTNPSQSDDKLWTRISKSELSLLKKDANIGKLIRRRLSQKKYMNAPLSRRLLAITMMHAPKLGLETAVNMIPLIIASFLTDCGLDLEDVATSSPSASTLKRIMNDEAVDTIYTERRDMKGLPLTLLADKGDGQSKRGTAYFIKLAARMDESRNRVKVTCIGIQGAGDSSIDAATAIDHALKVFDCPDSRVLFSGHGTDAGGGGTRADLLQKLIAVNRVRNSMFYTWTTCALHGLSLCLSSPTTRTMGKGGLLKRTVLQLLHSACNLSQQYNYSEWADIWTLLTGAKSENVKCPVMTRWECVGEAVENVVKNCEEWKVVAKNIVNTEKSGSTKYTIASHLSSLLCEKVLIAHLYFLRAYGNSWWLPYFQWQKHIDERSKSAGFLGRHMALHFYVQHRDLHFLINNWKTHEKFKEYVRTFPNNSIEYNMDKLANDFFKRVDDIHAKHFAQWRDKYLHLALAGDIIPARYLANWILALPNPSLPLEYFSAVHKTTINVEAALSFLKLNNTPESQRSKQYFINHRDAIIEIAEGKELWSEDSDCMRKFRQYVKNNWLIVSTNTQLVERWVNDSNECTLSGKDEHFSSIIATCRSATIFDYKVDARTEAEGRELKGNQYVEKGMKSQ